MPGALYLFAGLLGACVGSFLNVVIHRWPRRASVLRPRSYCPICQVPLRWHHIVPVLSYVWLRGRCAECKTPIPLAYPLVELATALAFVGVLHGFGASLRAAQHAALSALVIAAAEIDRRHGLIPNRLTAAGAVLGSGLALAAGVSVLETNVLAALTSSTLLLLIRGGSRRLWGQPGMGMGDVKLAAVTGLFLGWANFWVWWLAVLLGGMRGLAGLLTGRLSRTARLPFAPFVALGTGLHLFLLPAPIEVFSL